jgi:hypothetical protein
VGRVRPTGGAHGSEARARSWGLAGRAQRPVARASTRRATGRVRVWVRPDGRGPPISDREEARGVWRGEANSGPRVSGSPSTPGSCMARAPWPGSVVHMGRGDVRRWLAGGPRYDCAMPPSIPHYRCIFRPPGPAQAQNGLACLNFGSVRLNFGSCRAGPRA